MKRSSLSFGAMLVDHAPDVTTHGGEIDRGLVTVHAEAGAPADQMGDLRSTDQRLRRHAPVVEAVATHLALLAEDDTRAELRRAGRDAEARRSLRR